MILDLDGADIAARIEAFATHADRVAATFNRSGQKVFGPDALVVPEYWRLEPCYERLRALHQRTLRLSQRPGVQELATVLRPR